jgi:ATP-dependent Clp protease ATP-binding subunit ClpA
MRSIPSRRDIPAAERETTLTRETPLLAEFSRDLTESALKNQLDLPVGRDHERRCAASAAGLRTTRS